MTARVLLTSALLLASCGPEAVDRPGTWQATGLNDRNLRAMLADPAHAGRGTGAVGSRGDTAAAAAQRLREDKLRPLLDARGSQGGANAGR
ncbi:hypothetical protein [Roseomonas xinghualingensis]|uniref:hypothetical protein n=1 Tax=Roseomonas xinghualingensis TaxID=2986475 RepID=UPI0021F12957|nr:hypothetical protein [Roseomonas sp. SXEYE001]MCV4208700.1 hypothetical protein [Roseomonas sp. SXEYE001]